MINHLLFIQKDENFIEEVNEFQIKDIVINDLFRGMENGVFNLRLHLELLYLHLTFYQ